MTTAAYHTPSPQVVRRASLAGLLGTIVEAYDFFVFTFLIAYIAPVFFPSDDPSAGILISLAVLGTGFLARPLGGFVFGRLGDRRGRRTTLLVTIIGMGAATCLMGVLPTYAQVGLLAPLILVGLRLLQGLSAGGELMGSATFVSEHANKKNHGLLSSVTPLGFSIGTALAPGIVALTTALLGEETMRDWGWRLPLLLSLPLTATCLLLRLRLEDSPEFRRLADAHEIPTSPIRELITGYWRTLVKIILISAAVLLCGYISAAYFPIFLQQQAGLVPGTTAGYATIATTSAIAFVAIVGLIVDRLGRRTTMVTLLLLLGLIALPLLYLMKTTDGNPVVVILGWVLFSGLSGAASVPAYATFTAVFPVRVRYTGAAIGFGLGSAIGGGFGPYLAGQLTAWTSNPYAPAALVIVAVIVGIGAAFALPARGVVGDEGTEDANDANRHLAPENAR